MNQVLTNILNQFETQETLKASKNFCDLIEFIYKNDIEQDILIDKLHESLTNLYQKAIRLPKIELVVDENAESFKKSDNPEILFRLNEILDGHNVYSESHTPTIIDSKDNFLQGLLAEDIYEIYCDLKEISAKIEIGDDFNVQDALWELKFGLGAHWGNHLIDALRCLHYLRYGLLARNML